MKKLKDLLKNKLTKRQLELLPSSFDVVGDILIFSDFPDELKNKEKIIGQAVLDLLKNVKVVAKKTGKYSGKYRTPKIRIISGQRRKETLYKENNVLLKLHVEKVYFSSRLGNERKRISKIVGPEEKVLVMFSGCAPYPCIISKNSKAKEIYGIEINPIAHRYALENAKLNKISNVNLINGDVKKTIPKLNKKFDRILMPLPKGAEDYLDIALLAAKKGTIIHFYDFLNENEFDIGKSKVLKACKKAKKKCKIKGLFKCGSFSPRKYRVCIDFKIL